MAIVNLIGFDHFRTQAYTGSAQSSILANTLGAVSNGLVPFPGQDTGVMNNVLFNSNGAWGVTEVTLSSGKVRKFITTSPGNSSRVYYSVSNAIIDIPTKVGKWFIGVRVYTAPGSSPTVGQPATIAQFRLGSGATQAVTITAPGTYYVELELDWTTNTIKSYLNGVLQNTVTGTTYLDPTFTGKYFFIGMVSAFAPNPINGVTDIYTVIEEAGEVGTLSRLGPILVKPQPWQTAENVGRFTPPGSLSVLDQLNANYAMGTVAADYQYTVANVLTSAHGEIATLTATAPVETQQIVAAQITTLSHKLTQAAAGTQQQVRQGSATGKLDKTIPSVVTTPTRKTFGYNKALDGSAWSNAKIGQIKLDIGSYRP